MKDGKLTGSGLVRTFGGTHYTFSNATITDDKLVFSTKQVNNVWFEFEGEWLDNGSCSKNKDFIGRWLLRGKLQKYEGNKLVPDRFRDFVYFPEC